MKINITLDCNETEILGGKQNNMDSMANGIVQSLRNLDNGSTAIELKIAKDKVINDMEILYRNTDYIKPAETLMAKPEFMVMAEGILEVLNKYAGKENENE